MTRIVTTLIAVFILGCPLVAAQRACDDGPVVVVVKEKVPEQGSRTNRMPMRTLIECYYYPYGNSLELLFLSDLGTVTVSLDNQMTGEIRDYVVNSASGRVVIPVESDCAYRMDITTESGRSYYALFFTACEE